MISELSFRQSQTCLMSMIERVVRRFRSGLWWKIHCAGWDDCMDAEGKATQDAKAEIQSDCIISRNS